MKHPKAGGPDPEPAPAEDPARPRSGPRPRGPRGRPHPPDILYHATTAERVRRAVARGCLDVRGGRPVFLSAREAQAWHVAHRLGDEPMVLYVDVSRAVRAGCRFERNPQGLWQVASVPFEHVLNLHDDFAEQVSAGGIPVWFGPDGPEFALIQVHRRSGNSWEVAKGKLEVGEPPVDAAIREVREEMGSPMELEVLRALGAVRYGFFTPEGHPRLKTLHMFLLRTPERVADFAPADREGVRAVGWFTPRAAARVVPHRSLRPLMRRLRMLHEGDDPDDLSG